MALMTVSSWYGTKHPFCGVSYKITIPGCEDATITRIPPRVRYGTFE